MPPLFSDCLIISNRHEPNSFDLIMEEKAARVDATELAKNYIDRQHASITGYNIGINIGQDAGQTVMHFHQHLIPRRYEDMKNSAGGVRGVIPEKQKY